MKSINSDKILLQLAKSSLAELTLAVHRITKFGGREECTICGGKHETHSKDCAFTKAVDLLRYFYEQGKEENGK